jgi:hypothetical protein
MSKLVAMAEMLNVVRVVMISANPKIARVAHNPAIPVTYPVLINIITPKMVKTHGVKTPPNVPNLPPELCELLESLCFLFFIKGIIHSIEAKQNLLSSIYFEPDFFSEPEVVALSDFDEDFFSEEVAELLSFTPCAFFPA